jgi:catechol 2,3-dioxygenase-like lactoylglutathione lyase family enzyme
MDFAVQRTRRCKLFLPLGRAGHRLRLWKLIVDQPSTINDTIAAMPVEAPLPTRKFHFGLIVSNLNRAVEFYRVLLAAEPARHFGDYARFDVNDPPLVLALHPGPRHSGGALNHVGFRVESSEKLVAIQERLERRGIATQREEGVECCYALQTKFWVPDIDGNLWEIYTLQEDLDQSGFGGDNYGIPPRAAAGQRMVWEHILTSPIPARIPHADGEVSEVILEGTANADLSEENRRAFFSEIRRVLSPGGMVRVHGLVASQEFPGVPQLPGPAAMVRRIPADTETAAELAEAGFVGISHDTFADIRCLGMAGLELRESRIRAVKPAVESTDQRRFVVYLGPQASVTDERGRTFHRGRRTAVDEGNGTLFAQAPYAEHFACLRGSADDGAA